MGEFEILDLVSEDDEVIGCQKRKWFYENENHFYRVVNAFVIDEEGKILLPLRKKKTGRFSGLYDFSVGGHVLSGEDYKDAILRETKEELGIDVSENIREILYIKYPNVLQTSSFSKLYVISIQSKELSFEDKIESVSWCSVKEIEDILMDNPEMFKSDFPAFFSIYKSFFNETGNGTFYKLLKDVKVHQLIESSNYILENTGFVDHSIIHVGDVIKRAEMLCRYFGLNEEEIDMVKCACLLHDVGNNINRKFHELTGAMLAYEMLSKHEVECKKTSKILALIGNHDYRTGTSFNTLSAIVNLADKTDFTRRRVNKDEYIDMNEYEKAHFSIYNNRLEIEENYIVLLLNIDEKVCLKEKFIELSAGELKYAEQAAQLLGKKFSVEFI